MWLRIMLFSALLVIGFATTSAQEDTGDGSCPVLVQQAFEQMGDNCAGLGRNSACYGFNRVDATFTDVMDATFFSQPADQAGLATMQRIQTAPLDLIQDLWGIAVLNVQANVPNALPGQAVLFMLMGQVEVENAVDPADAVSGEPITIQVQTEAAVRTGPADNTNLLGTAPPNTPLTADGVSEDRGWVRVLYQRGPAWIDRDNLAADLDISDLPIVSDDIRTPMQAIHVRTAFNDIQCSEAPSLLAIQSPENLEVDLNINGADIRMGSMIMVRIIPPGNQMELTVIYGEVVLNAGTPDEIVVPAGYTTQTCVTEDGLPTTVDGCGWLLPVLAGPEQQQLAQVALQGFTSLGTYNGPLTINAPGARTLTIIDTDVCPAGSTVTHTVGVGDSLFLLSLQYNTTVDAIRFSNGLGDSTIVIGQELQIVCGARTPQVLPQVGAPPAPVNNPPAPPINPPAPVFDCSGFRATSPLDGLSYGPETFYWDPAASTPDEYRVTIIGESGASTFSTGGGNTSLVGDLSIESIGYGFSFTWYVEAIQNGQVVCASPPANIFREAPPPPPAPPEPPATEEPSPYVPPSEQELCESTGGVWVDFGEGEAYCDPFPTEPCEGEWVWDGEWFCVGEQPPPIDLD